MSKGEPGWTTTSCAEDRCLAHKNALRPSDFAGERDLKQLLEKGLTPNDRPFRRSAWIGYFSLAIAAGTVALVIWSLMNSFATTRSSPVASSRAASNSPTVNSVTLLDDEGSGDSKTQAFAAAGTWQIDWSYDCSNLGQVGNFRVIVYRPDGTLVSLAVSQLGTERSGSTNEHLGGTYYLETNSVCRWHIVVNGFEP